MHVVILRIPRLCLLFIGTFMFAGYTIKQYNHNTYTTIHINIKEIQTTVCEEAANIYDNPVKSKSSSRSSSSSSSSSSLYIYIYIYIEREREIGYTHMFTSLSLYTYIHIYIYTYK